MYAKKARVCDMSLTVRTGQPFLYRLKAFWNCNKKTIIRIAIILAILMAFLFVYSTLCASSRKDPNADDSEFTFASLVRTEITYICTGCSKETVKNAIQERFDAGVIEGKITGLLMSFSCTICAMLWMGSLITAYVNQQAYAELIVKKIIVLGVSIALIYNAPTIVQYIMDLGSSLADSIMDAGTDEEVMDKIDTLMTGIKKLAADKYNDRMVEYDKEYEALVKADEDAGFFKGLWTSALVSLKGFFGNWGAEVSASFRAALSTLSIALLLLIPVIATAVAFIMIMIACYSRGIEMAILRVLSPIPMGIIASEPFGSGAGARFLKNVAAVALQGVVLVSIPIIISGVLTNKLGILVSKLGANVAMGDIFAGCLGLAAVSIAEGVIMMRSLSIAQKAMGLQ